MVENLNFRYHQIRVVPIGLSCCWPTDDGRIDLLILIHFIFRLIILIVIFGLIRMQIGRCRNLLGWPWPPLAQWLMIATAMRLCFVPRSKTNDGMVTSLAVIAHFS